MNLYILWIFFFYALFKEKKKGYKYIIFFLMNIFFKKSKKYIYIMHILAKMYYIQPWGPAISIGTANL